MASTITAHIDGQTFTVDLDRVSALDAISYRVAVGEELEHRAQAWIEQGQVVFAADRGVVKWLWTRQQVGPGGVLLDPLASFAAVMSTVSVLDPFEPPADALAPSPAEVT